MHYRASSLVVFARFGHWFSGESSVDASMSLGYAEKLSYREDIGTVGQKELFDDEASVAKKSQELAELVISTSQCVFCATITDLFMWDE